MLYCVVVKKKWQGGGNAKNGVREAQELSGAGEYMVIRNYARQTDGLFARIIGKISALTVAQYINYPNNQPIGRVKYALV